MPNQPAQFIDQKAISVPDKNVEWLPVLEELKHLRAQLADVPQNFEAQSFTLGAGQAERILGFDLSRASLHLTAGAVGVFVGPAGSWRPGYSGVGPVSGYPVPFPPGSELVLNNAHEIWVFNSTDADITVSWFVEKFAQN